MSTLKISKHSDVPTAFDLVKVAVDNESRHIFSVGGDALKAGNFMKFCQSDIMRFLFLMTDEVLTTLAKEVPWFYEWKTADGLLDFTATSTHSFARSSNSPNQKPPTSPKPSTLSTPLASVSPHQIHNKPLE